MLLFGVLCGWAADTKLTGWFLPFPFLAWTIVYRDRRALWTLYAGGLVALVTVYAFNPCWWSAPIEGVYRFLVSNLGRARSIPIQVLFLGQVYRTPSQSLPWYNTLLWTAFVTPVGFLALALVGAAGLAHAEKRDPFRVLAVGHWLFLLLLRAFPHTPGHDGVRQFLPAFGILAIVAGLGAATLVRRLGRWGKLLIIAALAEGVASVALMMPVPLSYFSPLIGGLPGATKLGLEPTYFWDALSDEALDWLNRNTPPGGKVFFATNPTSWLYLRQTGRLHPETLPSAPGQYVWYVIQNRPGSFQPIDRALIERAHPAYLVTKLGVPLVWIFPFDELRRIAGTPGGR